MSVALTHQTVLLREAVDALSVKPSGVYVDGTFGRGGHSRAILAQLGPQGRLIAFDRDPKAVAAGREIADPRFELVHAPFSEFAEALAERGIVRVDGVLLDLGVSSHQLDTADRGFSFRMDGPLDMRMDPLAGVSAICAESGFSAATQLAMDSSSHSKATGTDFMDTVVQGFQFGGFVNNMFRRGNLTTVM